MPDIESSSKGQPQRQDARVQSAPVIDQSTATAYDIRQLQEEQGNTPQQQKPSCETGCFGCGAHCNDTVKYSGSIYDLSEVPADKKQGLQFVLSSARFEDKIKTWDWSKSDKGKFSFKHMGRTISGEISKDGTIDITIEPIQLPQMEGKNAPKNQSEIAAHKPIQTEEHAIVENPSPSDMQSIHNETQSKNTHSEVAPSQEYPVSPAAIPMITEEQQHTETEHALVNQFTEEQRLSTEATHAQITEPIVEIGSPEFYEAVKNNTYVPENTIPTDEEIKAFKAIDTTPHWDIKKQGDTDIPTTESLTATLAIDTKAVLQSYERSEEQDNHVIEQPVSPAIPLPTEKMEHGMHQDYIATLAQTHKEAERQLFSFTSILIEAIPIELQSTTLPSSVESIDTHTDDTTEITLNIQEYSENILIQYLIAAGATMEQLSGSIDMNIDTLHNTPTATHEKIFTITQDTETFTIRLVAEQGKKIQLIGSAAALEILAKKLLDIQKSHTTHTDKTLYSEKELDKAEEGSPIPQITIQLSPLEQFICFLWHSFHITLLSEIEDTTILKFFV